MLFVVQVQRLALSVVSSYYSHSCRHQRMSLILHQIRYWRITGTTVSLTIIRVNTSCYRQSCIRIFQPTLCQGKQKRCTFHHQDIVMCLPFLRFQGTCCFPALLSPQMRQANLHTCYHLIACDVTYVETRKVFNNLGIAALDGRFAKIPGTSCPGRQYFIPMCLIFLVPQCGTVFVLISWRLEFLGGFQIFENFA